MGYKVESINAEEAKKEIVSFDYALIYMISEVILKRIDELEERLKCIDKQFKDCAWRLRELTKE